MPAKDAAGFDDAPGTGLTLPMAIRWGDMDALGHVNNVVFFQYCESARIAYFEKIDLDAFATKPTDGPAIVSASLNFRRQLRYPGTVSVTVHTVRVSKRSFTLSQHIHDEAGELAADGESVCVWVDYEAGKAKELPQPLIDAIRTIEQNPGLGKAE